MFPRFFLVAVLLFCALAPAHADSPLTSTEMWRAYRDVPEVRTALDIERLNTALGRFLLSKAPIDQKIAVVNALSWNLHGKENALLFREMLGQKYRCAPNVLEGRLTPDETLCLGYLVALDDYFHPRAAAPLVEAARMRLPRSFTAAMVAALVRAQQQLFEHRLARIWPDTKAVLDDRRLLNDMRPQARAIIVHYMKLYATMR